MEEAKQKFKELKEELKEYVRLQSDYYYFKLIDKVSTSIALVSILLILLLSAFMLVLLLSFGLAIWLNYQFDSFFLGFGLAALVYFLIISILMIFRKSLTHAIAGFFIRAIMDSGEDEKTAEEGNEEKEK
ncbi:MAG: hypothetical protein EA412_13705 [Chitinophagaceae bacterium]|nr:MAG: hypothetical protein EA412_13705 [Chitinophagaceae bacterium]